MKVQLRLTRSGYKILVQLPLVTDFRLSVVAKGSPKLPGSNIVQVNDEWLSSCKSVWASSDALAQSVAGNKRVLEVLKAICVSPLLEVCITGSTLEVRGDAPESFITEDALISLVTNLETIKRLLRPLSRPEKPSARYLVWMFAAVAVCVVVLGAVALTTKQRMAASPQEVHAFVDPGWQAISADDIDTNTSGWIRNRARGFRGSFPLNTGTDGTYAQVDILKKVATTPALYRVVVRMNQQVVSDQTYPALAIAVAVPTKDFSQSRWIGHKPDSAIGPEALLIVKNDSDLSSGEVLTFEKNSIRVYRPQDFTRF